MCNYVKNFTISCIFITLLTAACFGQQDSNEAIISNPRTYYIDSNSGDDTNSGTNPDNPWQTLKTVNNHKFNPGDKILFKAGTQYTGQLSPSGSGIKEAPIIIDTYGQGEKPRIDGNGILDTVLLRNIEHWEVNNLEITNLGDTRQDWRTGVHILAENCGTLHHIHIRNLYVHDVNGSNNKNTEGCGIYFECKGRTQSRIDDLLIENCHLVRTDRNGICGRSSFTNRNSNWYPSLNVVIRNNLLEDIGGDCIKPWGCDGCLVEYNVVRGGRQRAEDYAAGIWPWSCDNTIIQFNEVSGMKGTKDGQGFDSDYNSTNSLFQYNYSHDNDGGFMLVCSPRISRSNIGCEGTVIRYNISQNDGARIFQISGPVNNTKIYNNIFYVPKDRDIYAVLYTNWDGFSNNTLFKNNIFYIEGKVQFDFGQSRNNTYSNNAFWGNIENRPDDPNAVITDPKLVAPGSGKAGLNSLTGYKLQNDSPCIGTGTRIDNSGSRDFWGTSLANDDKWDIGAQAIVDSLELNVMTFNIRYGSANDGINNWNNRREMVFEIFRNYNPDIVGLQEALDFQITEIRKAVPQYGRIGVGREDGKNEGEYSALLYRLDRFDVNESGTFWFSDTPEIPGSSHWGNACVRICTWARFIEKESDKTFYVFNLHLDHVSQPSREKSAVLLVQRIQNRKHKDPFVITGDFNTGQSNPVVLYLKGKTTIIGADGRESKNPIPMVDTFRVLNPNIQNVGTAHSFMGTRQGDKIDYILTSSLISVLNAKIIYDNIDGRYPSDHFPVSALIEIK